MKPFILLSIVIAISDQVMKQMIVRTLDQCGFSFCDSIDLLPFLKLVLLYNDGAAFSILSDAGGWQRWFLSIVSFAVSCFIFFWIRRLKSSEVLLGYALAAILGGAIGNLIDRVLLGHVVDFILLFYENFYFPAFNVADASISVGALLLIIDMFYNNKGRDKHENKT